ncbi:hypothetical protein ACFOEK_08355 [Litoribrevibacter euphylliae]|uniref:Uncharacterized protein n=1 Tax=Litoribrevibacter euphylliae TaxID=1834034 RepID=A0ABV7HE87_9GAMM
MAYRILLAPETQVSKMINDNSLSFIFNDSDNVKSYLIGIVDWRFYFKKSDKIKSLKIDPIGKSPSISTSSGNTTDNKNQVTITPEISMDGDNGDLDTWNSYIQFVCIANVDEVDSAQVSFGPTQQTVDCNTSPPTQYQSQFTLDVDEYSAFWSGCNTSYGDHEQIQALDIYTLGKVDNNELTITGQSQFKNSSEHSGTSQAFANFLGVTAKDEAFLEIKQVETSSGQTKLQTSDQIKVAFGEGITYAVPLITALHADFKSNQHTLYKIGGGVNADSNDGYKPYFSFQDSVLSIDQGASAVINGNDNNQNDDVSYVSLIAVGVNQPVETNQPQEPTD